ncbi:MAG: Crp/Fnr family transcriptional regulator [Methylomonas sp.]|jgi:CRP/FNR family transcriptional regulator|uniref:Crp/Fnr family transcriptional regulator n=1 Tax=Methylomonas sp. TaxID=418 RepID=UPI0025E9BB66|nr:Crp/Fnr family transcriptional regulator [Methylomonas sp.]MCK9605712.1 Crp/Fnr family transcriptional regulator [Methylomonas sp.]
MLQFGYHQLLQGCRECGKIKRCFANDLVGNPLDPVTPNLLHDLIQPKGRYIYYQGEDIKNLFFLKAGSVKNIYANNQGDQQIINFYFPGEVIGLAHLYHSYYLSSAITLEKSIVCAFSLPFIQANCEKFPNLLKNILEHFNAEILHCHESLLAINHGIASKRLGVFLLDLIHRQNLAHNRPILIRLTMSRADIANYLGLAPETVSRVLGKYEKSGLILANKKKIQINNLNKLTALVG